MRSYWFINFSGNSVVLGLEWPVKPTFVILRITCNAGVGAENLPKVLGEVHFMHLAWIMFTYRETNKFRTGETKTIYL